MPWSLMRRLLPMSLLDLIDKIKKEWHVEDTLHMKKVAQRYAERASMDGYVIRKSGEIIPRESA
jgi:hypothetical protein